MVTKQELVDGANQIIVESEKGGNTASRVGSLFLAFIEFIAAVEGKVVDIPEYDDSDIQAALQRLQDAVDSLKTIVDDTRNLASSERDRLSELLNNLDSQIKSTVSNLLETAAWKAEFAKQIQQTVNEGEVAWQSGWDKNIEAYIQRVGVWARDGNVTSTQWSDIITDVNSITSSVNKVTQALDGKVTKTEWSEIKQTVDTISSEVNAITQKGEVSEALQSSIKQYIKDGVAGMNLGSLYAKKESEDSTKVLEWLYSGLRQESAEQYSFNSLVSAGKDALTGGISEIRTSTEAVMKGEVLELVQKASLEAKVEDSIAALYAKADKDSAENSFFVQVKKTVGDVVTYNDAGVVTKADQESAIAALYASSKAEMEGRIIDATAGMAAESYVNKQVEDATTGLTSTISEAKASLLASIEDGDKKVQAGVMAKVQTVKDAQQELSTAHTDLVSKVDGVSVGLTATTTKLDDFTGKGYKEAVLNLFADVGDGKTAALRLFARANEDTEINLNADRITMTDAFANSITANKAFIGYLEGGNATFDGYIIARSLTLGKDLKIPSENVDGLVEGYSKLRDVETKTTKNTEKATQLAIDLTALQAIVDTKTDEKAVKTWAKNNGVLFNGSIKVETVGQEGGLVTQEITVPDSNGDEITYTTVKSANWVLTNVGLGTKTDDQSKSYTLISDEGLLTAYNAIIYGTVYATDGKFTGEVEATSGSFRGTVYATDGEFTGKITATSLTLKGTTIPKENVRDLSGDLDKINNDIKNNNDDIDTLNTNVGTINNNIGDINNNIDGINRDINSLNTNINNLNTDINTINSDINGVKSNIQKNYVSLSNLNTQLQGYIKTDGFSSEVEKILNGKSYLTADKITTSDKEVDGLYITTINVGGKEFNTVTNGNWVLTNVGIGAGEKDTDVDFFKVDTNGLLTAHNAIIYGTVYANNGKFSGEVTATSGSIGGLTISGGVLQSSTGYTGLTGNWGGAYYADNASPLAFWSGNDVPTAETWVSERKTSTTTVSSLWVRFAVTTTSGVIYTLPTCVARSTYNYIYYAVQNATITSTPSSWTSAGTGLSFTLPSSSRKEGYHVWIKLTNNSSDVYIHIYQDASTISSVQYQYADGQDIWRNEAQNTPVSGYLWARCMVNTGNYNSSIFTASTPVLLGSAAQTVTLKYALQKSGIASAPTSGWTSISSDTNTVTLTASERTKGYKVWVEYSVTNTGAFYSCLDEDASNIYQITIQFRDCDNGGPTFAVTQQGALYASSGRIGGLTLDGNRVILGGGKVGLQQNGYYSGTAIWAGSTDADNAPFRVQNNGVLYAASGQIGNMSIINYGDVNYVTAPVFGLAGKQVSSPTTGKLYYMTTSESYIEVTSSTISTVYLPQYPMSGSFVIVYNGTGSELSISVRSGQNYVGETISTCKIANGRCFVGLIIGLGSSRFISTYKCKIIAQ